MFDQMLKALRSHEICRKSLNPLFEPNQNSFCQTFNFLPCLKLLSLIFRKEAMEEEVGVTAEEDMDEAFEDNLNPSAEELEFALTTARYEEVLTTCKLLRSRFLLTASNFSGGWNFSLKLIAMS